MSILGANLDIIDAPIIKSDIMAWINKYTSSFNVRISNTQNSDGKYVVNADGVTFKVSVNKLTNGMFVWGYIKNDFICDGLHIKSLNGSPKSVGGNFNCCHTLITTLEGAPDRVGCVFDCSECERLISLKGSPKYVWLFDCSRTQIASLEGAPEEIIDDFYCDDTKLTSLKYLPKNLGGVIHYFNTPFYKSIL